MALNDYVAMQERCSNCLSCKWIPYDKIKSQRFGENCPSECFYNFNAYSARGRFQLALALNTGAAEYTDTVTGVVHNCLSCGLCDVSCKVQRYNLEPLEHNLALKSDAVSKGHTLPAQAKIMAALAKEKTMIPGTAKAARADWSQGLGLKDLSKQSGETLFFPGCKYSYDSRLRRNVQASVRILQKAGVDLGYMGASDMCCAGRALQMGYKDEFAKNAEANVALFKRAGVRTIVTPCSDCYHALKRQYPALGLDVEVLHVVEYVERLVKAGKLKFTKTVPLTVTYHDPCHLGRLGEPYGAWNGHEKKILNQVHTWEPRRPRYNGAYGIYDAPRAVLESIPGVVLAEMERIREYSWCCGAGGGCSETNPEFSTWTASERVAEANATGAQALVTACPWCETNFRGVADENGKTIEVVDIIELVEKAI
jgi:Fe-S oxidoreductase